METAAYITTITAKGQITIPLQILEAAGLRPGDRVEFRVLGPGRLLIEKAKPRQK